MGHMDNGAHGAIVYRGYGVQGYRPHGLWGTEGMVHMGNGYRSMRHMGNGVQLAMGYRGYGVQGYRPHELAQGADHG